MWLNPTNMRGLSIERVGIVPYPEGTELPQTAINAFRDLIRFTATLQPKESRNIFRELVEEIEPSRIIQIAKGEPVEPPLNDFEYYTVLTLEHCQRKGWLTTDDQVVRAIRSVKQEVLRGSLLN